MPSPLSRRPMADCTFPAAWWWIRKATYTSPTRGTTACCAIRRPSPAITPARISCSDRRISMPRSKPTKAARFPRKHCASPAAVPRVIRRTFPHWPWTAPATCSWRMPATSACWSFWPRCSLPAPRILATSQSEPCRECGQPPQDTGQALMFPRFGYTTAAWDPPKPPSRNLDRVGKVKLTPAGGFTLSAATKEASNFGGITGLMATYYEAGQGQLLLRNAGGEAFSELGHGFAVCTRCGFAMSEEKPSNAKSLPALQKKFRDHASVFSSNQMTRCWPNSLQYDPVLRHKVLAAKETTECLILDWPADSDKASLYSLGRALVLAGTRMRASVVSLAARTLCLSTGSY